jgi:aldehyde dehydrogenase (NAD+)
MLVERAKKLKVGNGLDESVDMGPCVNKGQLETVLSYIEIGKKEGGQLLCGGEQLTGGDYDKGFS